MFIQTERPDFDTEGMTPDGPPSPTSRGGRAQEWASSSGQRYIQMTYADGSERWVRWVPGDEGEPKAESENAGTSPKKKEEVQDGPFPVFES